MKQALEEHRHMQWVSEAMFWTGLVINRISGRDKCESSDVTSMTDTLCWTEYAWGNTHYVPFFLMCTVLFLPVLAQLYHQVSESVMWSNLCTEFTTNHCNYKQWYDLLYISENNCKPRNPCSAWIYSRNSWQVHFVIY